MSKAKAPGAPAVGRLTDFAEYNAAAERLRGLRDRLAEARRVVAEPAEPPAPDVEHAARILLEGGTGPEYGPALAAQKARQEKRRQAELEVPIIRRALELAEEDFLRVKDACSRKIGAALRPVLAEHARLFTAAADEACRHALALLDVAERLRAELAAAGATAHGLPIAGVQNEEFAAIFRTSIPLHLQRLASYHLSANGEA